MARWKTARFGRDTGFSGMLVKTILVFLGLMVLVALIGRALFPTALPRVMRKDLGRKAGKPPVCAKCGRYLIGRKTCDCGDKMGGDKAK